MEKISLHLVHSTRYHVSEKQSGLVRHKVWIDTPWQMWDTACTIDETKIFMQLSCACTLLYVLRVHVGGALVQFGCYQHTCII